MCRLSAHCKVCVCPLNRLHSTVSLNGSLHIHMLQKTLYLPVDFNETLIMVGMELNMYLQRNIIYCQQHDTVTDVYKSKSTVILVTVLLHSKLIYICRVGCFY